MRKKLTPSLQRRILIRNKHCCCICQNDGYGKEFVIHHIDGNNSHNTDSNLAVLCLIHASQADAGLRRGKLGSGRKLTPDAVKQYKRLWEKRVEVERQYRKESIPLSVRRQLEILYRFEIHRAKNVLLSLPDSDKRVNETFDYFDQLVLEEFISGVNIRAILLHAYSDMAAQSIDAITLPQKLARSLWGLLLHLIGPEEVAISAKDKKIFTESVKILETIGEFAAEFGGGRRVLTTVCQVLCDFAEIAGWYNLCAERPRLDRVFRKLDQACAEYRSPRGVRKHDESSDARRAIVRKYWQRTKRLSDAKER